MTAVVGILNKRGIAIAADSAVTMERGYKGEKISNTGNKMLRLSSANPISVMITGNARFIKTPWDIIIRRYRQKRGNISFSTVQACIEDFFSYIPTEEAFFCPELEKTFLRELLFEYWEMIERDLPDSDGEEKSPKDMIRIFRKSISDIIMAARQVGTCQNFNDYDFERFKSIAGDVIDKHLKNITNDDFPLPGQFPSKVIDAIRQPFEHGFYSLAIAYPQKSTTLVFSGYGDNEEYPVLINAVVGGGFDGLVRCYMDVKNFVKISDDNPTAICPFAQSDVMYGLLTGITPDNSRSTCNFAKHLFSDYFSSFVFPKVLDNSMTPELKEIIDSIKYDDLTRHFLTFNKRLRISQRKQWLKALCDYDLQDMARLAENLIALTCFERHMTFSPEGVGGPIDLAIITKNEGFVWLNRKSWYHHKDVGGRYGKFGV